MNDADQDKESDWRTIVFLIGTCLIYSFFIWIGWFEVFAGLLVLVYLYGTLVMKQYATPEFIFALVFLILFECINLILFHPNVFLRSF